MKGKARFLGSINREVFMLSFVFFILVTTLFAGVCLDILYGNSITAAQNSLKACNSQIVTYTEGIFRENASVADILSRNEDVIYAGERDDSAALEIYDDILRKNANITYIYSGYETGKLLINNYNEPLNYELKGRPWYQAAQNTDGVARLVYQDAATGIWLFSQCMKLTDEDGNIKGVISLDCSNESISKQLSTKYQYRSQRSYIINQEGNVLIHPDELRMNESIQAYLDQNTWKSITKGKNNYAEYEVNGKKSMAYFEKIPQTSFMIVTAIDAYEIIEPIKENMAAILVLIIAISIILGMILSRILFYRFARPIMTLGVRIQHIAEGKMKEDQKLIFSNAEINSIALGIERIVKEMAEREERRKAAEHLSFHDSMTGIYNRRYFDERKGLLDTAENYPLCFICCDINGLKMVNDTLGHDVGDRLICRVADCLKNECQSTDMLARIGGDEFVVIAPGTSGDAAKKRIDQMKIRLSRESIFGIQVSVSIGYAVKENSSKPLDAMIHAADEMMYGKKKVESIQMKQNTAAAIIKKAGEEGFVAVLSEKERYVLERLGDRLCPKEMEQLIMTYQFRRIGLCSLFNLMAGDSDGTKSRYTENGYRLLAAMEHYKNAAEYVLHYTEHWDGSGLPDGLREEEIPVISRIVAILDAYATAASPQHPEWLDPHILEYVEEAISYRMKDLT